MPKKFIVFLILITCCLLSCSEPKETDGLEQTTELVIPDNKIRIFITSTLESRFEPFICSETQESVVGLARLMTALETKRAEGIPSITVSNGNDVGGEIYEYFYGVATMQVLEAMKYDLICPGIAEFSKGEVVYAASLRNVNFSLVLSNAIIANRGVRRKLHSNIIKEINGYKIGFFGFADPELENKAKLHENSSIIRDFEKLAETEVNQLRNSGAEIIILLSNLPNERDIEIAKKVKGIHFIINSSEKIHPKIASISYEVTKNENIQKEWGTLIINCSKFGTHLGVLDLTFDKVQGSVVISQHKFEEIKINSEAAEHPELKKMIEDFLSGMPN